MAKLYREYLNVDADFIPVFNENKDKQFPDRWKSFYPHNNFQSILAQLIDTLQMNSVEKTKPIWMSGAYGTGKTFASFVIKHILEDDLAEIKPYFEINNMHALYSKLSGIRIKGDILVVNTSSSSRIINDNRLINAIREATKNKLRNEGYTYFGAKSQYDIVLTSLKDESSSFNFGNAFNKHKGYFQEYFTNEGNVDTDLIIRDLEELDLEDSLDLLETIIEVAEKEKYIWDTSVQNLIDWIDDIRKHNNLQAIVFIWDEFTEFFKKNQNNITGLQKIAEASDTIKFFLFLITHQSSEIINDPAAKKVIETRFKLPVIEMADATAFQLMGNAIKTNPDLLNEWGKETEDLWQRVERCAKESIIKYSDNINEGELKALLPLHPYAAYLLKIISKDISSNQRTMFQFLSGDYEDGGSIKANFRWFIDNYSNEMNKWNYLTADIIWDYFFTSENIDFDAEFKSVMSQYANYESFFDQDRKGVLKVALILTALQQKSGASRARGLTGLLRPTLSNISDCFIGTPLQSSIAGIMTEFAVKQIFSKIEEGTDILFVQSAGVVDTERLEKLKSELKIQLPFEKVLEDATYSIYERFLPNDYLKYRFIIKSITPSDYKSSIEKLMVEKPNKIPMFYLFAKNESEQSKIKLVLEKIYTIANREVVVVDFSNQIFTDTAYEKFISSKAEEKYFLSNPSQKNQSELAKRNAKNIIDEWKNKLDMTGLDIYFDIVQVVKCQGGVNLRKRISGFNESIFNCGLEEVSKHDKVFSEIGYKETVAQMAMGKIPMSTNYSYLNSISAKLANENIWNNIDYYKTNQNHPISKMKLDIEKTINEGFNRDRKIAIIDIWKMLEKKPYGLLSCTGSVFLLGFLLKEYADSFYYKHDGVNTVSLNYSDLSELIFAVVKGNPKANNQYIVKQTPEHVEFCKITGKIFKIAADKQNSIDDIAKYIKIFLSSNEYPLWSLKCYAEEELAENDGPKVIVDSINNFCEFVSNNDSNGKDKTKIAEDLYKIYKSNAGIDDVLEQVVRVENMKLGMQYYIEKYKPEIIKLTRSIGITADEYLYSLNKKMSADASYLWVIGDTNRQIDNLYEDIQLINVINGVLPERKKTFEKASKALKDKLNLIKIPSTLLLDERTDLVDIFKCLDNIKNDTIANKADLIQTIGNKAEVFNSFFNNQFSDFAKIIKSKVNKSLSNDEVENLFDKIETGALNKQPEAFLQFINIELDKYRRDKKINQLYRIWQEKTESESPKKWSEKHIIPILCLYQNDIVNTQIVFDIINKTRLAKTEVEIDWAIDYISSDKLDKLTNLMDCDEEFRKYFSGAYDLIIDDSKELKLVILKDIIGDVYDWIVKKIAIDNSVKKYAEIRYQDIYKAKVKEKINKLSAENAQKFLQILIEDKPLVGIDILKE